MCTLTLTIEDKRIKHCLELCIEIKEKNPIKRTFFFAIYLFRAFIRTYSTIISFNNHIYEIKGKYKWSY